jgi:hypothetical protein
MKPLPPRHIGLGEAMKILTGSLPVPNVLRQKMASCGGCARRAAKLDALVPNINPFAARAPEGPSSRDDSTPPVS